MSCLAVSAEAMVLPVRHTALRCLVLVIGVLWSATATGSGRPGRFVGLRLERLDASTCDDGLVRAHVTDVAIDGEIRRRPAGSYRLLLPDGQLLRAEREQGITIDVAYRYFSTPKRRFILADTPGHEQYTRNMATGASTADLAIILIDARKGVITQTKRHSFIA